NAPRGSHLETTTVPLTIKGPRRVVDKMDKDTLEAYIDVGAEANDGQTSVEKPVSVRPELPERTQIVAPVPKVEVQIVPSKKIKRR
ncbi:MAG TPA: hypothetical protein VFH51_18805, partial [Myxococcota bacterium]|nr:hypothetical protein [Myxococcota bacterium]